MLSKTLLEGVLADVGPIERILQQERQLLLERLNGLSLEQALVYHQVLGIDLICIVDRHLPVGVYGLGAVSDRAVGDSRMEVVDGRGLSVQCVVELTNLTSSN